MRIDRLDLIAYGPFTGKSLDLSTGKSGLHLIYGDNEAGKSTSLRALTAWLFGIPTRTSDNFLHGNPQLRIGGKLQRSDGRALEFIRRKGNKGTLLEYDEAAPLEDDALAPFIPGGIDESLFTQLWGIDHGRLIAGGRELLEQSGDLGQALFSAAVGTASLREILSDLQGKADSIFKPRGSRAYLNQAIADFKEAQKRIKERSLPIAEWKRLRKDLSDTLGAVEQTEEKIEAKSREKSRLERLNRVKGALAERRALLGRIMDLGTVLLLPEDFEAKRKNASDELQRAGEKKQRAEAKIARLVAESERFSVRHELLANEETISEIYKELGAVEKIVQDRPQQEGKQRVLRNEARTLLKGVRPDLDLDRADALRPLLNNKRWISELAQSHKLLSQKKEKAEATLRDTEDEQERLKNKLDDKPALAIDLDALKATVAAVHKAGDVEKRLVEARKRAGEEKARCENELARLGRFTGTVSSLLKTALPEPEVLEAFETENDELAERLRDLQRRELEIAEERKQIEQALKALLLGGDVPTMAELKSSRQDRDRVWRAIKGKYVEKADIAADFPEYAAAADLPNIFEKKIDTADHVADRLRSAADQVVKRADFEARIENLSFRREEIAAEIEKVSASGEAYQVRWAAIWAPAAIDAGTPREMKQWVVRAEKLMAAAQSANAVAGEALKLAGECERLRNSLSAQMIQLDASIDQQSMSLEAMVSFCEQRIKAEDERCERQRQVAQSLEESAIRMQRIRVELKSIDTDQIHWSQQWRQAIEGLGLKPDAHPEQAMGTFDRLVAFFEKFDKSEELRKRIYGMDQAATEFERRVAALAARAGFNGDGQGAADVAAHLHREMNSAREARARLEKIEAQIREVKEEIEDAVMTIQASKDQLAALRHQACVETDGDLIPAEEKSRQKRELQNRLDMLDQELNRNGDGLSIEELEKESHASDVDSIGGQLGNVTIELKELQATRDDLRDRRQTLQNEIRAKDGSAAAANASEEAEEHLAAMVANAEQYLRLQIAALILEQRVEAYRKKNQAPVLARAGALFSRLTLGAFARLRDELDTDGKPVLLGVRPDDQEVTIDGMSEGTRDQLFLALRIATLEQHLRKGEPMPFIVDDILIGFDDHRTKVCLEVLAELAADTQVLLFTHHRRDIQLAAAIEAQAGIFIHDLA